MWFCNTWIRADSACIFHQIIHGKKYIKDENIANSFLTVHALYPTHSEVLQNLGTYFWKTWMNKKIDLTVHAFHQIQHRLSYNSYTCESLSSFLPFVLLSRSMALFFWRRECASLMLINFTINCCLTSQHLLDMRKAQAWLRSSMSERSLPFTLPEYVHWSTIEL